ncbi:MAG TPA: hypothetical protein VID29_00455 [Solirubrobacteraceae bacterium]|jgi:hypothetical protein
MTTPHRHRRALPAVLLALITAVVVMLSASAPALAQTHRGTCHGQTSAHVKSAHVCRQATHPGRKSHAKRHARRRATPRPPGVNIPPAAQPAPAPGENSEEGPTEGEGEGGEEEA